MLTRSPLPHPPCAPFTEAESRRFWAKVAIAGPGECWRWAASTGGSQYGHCWVTLDGERHCLDAHKLAFLLSVGPIPPEMHVLHTCNCKTCVNPRHLRLGTAADNARAALSDGLMRTKIAPGDVLAVLRERQAGRLVVEIAGKRGVRAGHVKRILRGEHWAAVTGLHVPPTSAPGAEQLALPLQETAP